jgi:hypothetical protein
MLAHDLNQFVSGGIFIGELTIALLFQRFWSRTGDRLFRWFSAAFLILATERVLLFWNLSAHDRPLVYLTRLLAFTFIIVGVIDHNRRSKPRQTGDKAQSERPRTEA